MRWKFSKENIISHNKLQQKIFCGKIKHESHKISQN
jgi:hypothetical protein